MFCETESCHFCFESLAVVDIDIAVAPPCTCLSATTDDAETLGLQHHHSFVTPEQWDSSLCMEHWGRKELMTEADPNGYIVFVSGS